MGNWVCVSVNVERCRKDSSLVGLISVTGCGTLSRLIIMLSVYIDINILQI
jgi:hypothetical protein